MDPTDKKDQTAATSIPSSWHSVSLPVKETIIMYNENEHEQHQHPVSTTAATKRNEDEPPCSQQEQSQRRSSSTIESVFSNSKVSFSDTDYKNEPQLSATTTAMRRNKDEDEHQQPSWSPPREQSPRQPVRSTIESVAAPLEVSFLVAHDTKSISNDVCQVSYKSRNASDAVTDGDYRVATSSPPLHNSRCRSEIIVGEQTATNASNANATETAHAIVSTVPERDIHATITTATTASSSLLVQHHQHHSTPVLDRERLRSYHKELSVAPVRLARTTTSTTTHSEATATSTTQFEAVSSSLSSAFEQVTQKQPNLASTEPSAVEPLATNTRKTEVQVVAHSQEEEEKATLTTLKSKIKPRPNNKNNNMSIATMTPPPPPASNHHVLKKPKKRRSSGASVSSAAVSAAESTSASTPSNQQQQSVNNNNNGTSGRWTDEEHTIFLSGLAVYGREWKKVAAHIPTRTSAQVRSHAQKYFAKMQRDQLMEIHTGLDTTSAFTPAAYWQNAAAAVAAAPAHRSLHVCSVVGTTTTTTPMMTSSSSAPNTRNMHMDTTAATCGASTYTTATSTATATAARILAQPESVRAEVEDTLGRLRERYQQLQRQLQHRAGGAADNSGSSHHLHGTGNAGADSSNGGGGPSGENDNAGNGVTAMSATAHVPEHDDLSLSVASAASASAVDDFSNDEWIALSVLRGALPHGDSYSQAGSDTGRDSMDMDEDRDHTDHVNAAGDDADSHGATNDEGSRDSTEPSDGSLPKRARLD